MSFTLRIVGAMLLVASTCALPRRIAFSFPSSAWECTSGSSASMPVPRSGASPTSVPKQSLGTSEILLCQHVAGDELPGGPISWQPFAQGEYIGPAREPHVPEYQLRVDDELEFVYRLTREASSQNYQLEVGDVIRLESHIDVTLTREATVQPDGTVDLLYLGPVRVVRRTVEEIAKDLNERYAKFYKVTDINVARTRTQTRLGDLLAAVDTRHASRGQINRVRITPAGTLSLPSIGAVPAQGLSLDEIKREVEARYRELVGGVEVTPILIQRAPRYVFVVGEVRRPGRYDLCGPTTVMQSLALAGGWKQSGNLRQIAVFRRTEDWGLLATKIDVQDALDGACPSPADEIWLRDSDLVVVPKSSGHWCDAALGHLFGRGKCDGGGCSVIDEGVVSR